MTGFIPSTHFSCPSSSFQNRNVYSFSKNEAKSSKLINGMANMQDFENVLICCQVDEQMIHRRDVLYILIEMILIEMFFYILIERKPSCNQFLIFSTTNMHNKLYKQTQLSELNGQKTKEQAVVKSKMKLCFMLKLATFLSSTRPSNWSKNNS